MVVLISFNSIKIFVLCLYTLVNVSVHYSSDNCERCLLCMEKDGFIMRTSDIFGCHCSDDKKICASCFLELLNTKMSDVNKMYEIRRTYGECISRIENLYSLLQEYIGDFFYKSDNAFYEDENKRYEMLDLIITEESKNYVILEGEDCGRLDNLIKYKGADRFVLEEPYGVEDLKRYLVKLRVIKCLFKSEYNDVFNKGYFDRNIEREARQLKKNDLVFNVDDVLQIKDEIFDFQKIISREDIKKNDFNEYLNCLQKCNNVLLGKYNEIWKTITNIIDNEAEVSEFANKVVIQCPTCRDTKCLFDSLKDFNMKIKINIESNIEQEEEKEKRLEEEKKRLEEEEKKRKEEEEKKRLEEEEKKRQEEEEKKILGWKKKFKKEENKEENFDCIPCCCCCCCCNIF